MIEKSKNRLQTHLRRLIILRERKKIVGNKFKVSQP
jgi:hypothetical protein